ncbi:hypothetical protein LWI29_012015 [Acer saccharum]|uniref:Integrase zinc-binding domain-containing protein n=1 Tax=Acer saccharum TaxID=4024 RepID=A0AA39SMI7_ACESA|nr:hypothetical protein LWI29_012015 [Acer saccharum]
MATKGRIDMLVRFSCLLLLLTGNSYSQRDKLLQADELKDGDELLSAFGKFIAAGVVLLVPLLCYLCYKAWRKLKAEGTSNRVADALSRRSTLLSTMTVSIPGFESLRELIVVDPYFANIMSNLGTTAHSDFLLVDGFLFRGNQLCVPKSSLRMKIISELHGEGHVGRDRTLQLVRDSYFGRQFGVRWRGTWSVVTCVKF